MSSLRDKNRKLFNIVFVDLNTVSDLFKYSPTKLGHAVINFSRFKWRAIAIAAIVALLIIATQLCLGFMRDENSTHYLKTLGSCDQPTTIKIYDETGGIDPAVIKSKEMWGETTYKTGPVNTLENKHFKNYVSTISKYVFAKVNAMGLCQQATGKPNIELVFVYRPMISRGITPYEFQPKKSQNTKQLDSPWVKLTLDKSPKLDLKAAFFWNERQFLLDQLLMLEWRTSADTKQLLPIKLETFDKWEQDFDSYIPTKNANVVNSLPVDIQWLFGGRVTPLAGGQKKAVESLKSVAEGSIIGYTDITECLISRLFTSSSKEVRYASLFKLKEIFNIDKYRIYPYDNEEAFKQTKLIFREYRSKKLLGH